MKRVKLFLISLALNIVGFYFLCKSGVFGVNGMTLHPENEPEQYISLALFIISLIVLIVAICLRGTDFAVKLMFAGTWLMMNGATVFIYYGSFLPGGAYQAIGSGSKGMMYPYEIGGVMFWGGLALIAICVIVPLVRALIKKIK